MPAKVYAEGARESEFLRSSSYDDRSFEKAYLHQDAEPYVSGTVMKLDGEKHRRFDGTGTPSGILRLSVDATAADDRGALVVRDATYVIGALIWGAGVTDAQKVTAMESMAARGLAGRPYGEDATP